MPFSNSKSVQTPKQGRKIIKYPTQSNEDAVGNAVFQGEAPGIGFVVAGTSPRYNTSCATTIAIYASRRLTRYRRFYTGEKPFSAMRHSQTLVT